MKLVYLRRFIGTVFVIWGAVTAVFLISRVLPGDPVDVMLGERATAVEREAMRQALGLDKPLMEQYVWFLKSLSQGHLGKSFFFRKKVEKILGHYIFNTFKLAGFAVVASLPLAFFLAFFAALRPGGKLDKVVTFITAVSFSVPTFWSGPMLILLFSIYLGLLPVGGMRGAESIILPGLTLSIPVSAAFIRHMRAYLLEARNSFFTMAAMARGRSLFSAMLTGGFLYALMPFITILGLEAGSLLTGAVITEAVFAWPGLGHLVVLSIQARDFPLLQGCVIAISTVYVVVNLVTDILYTLVDPRVRAV